MYPVNRPKTDVAGCLYFLVALFGSVIFLVLLFGDQVWFGG